MRNGPGQLMARPVLGRSRLPTAVWWEAVWAAGWRRDLATGTLPGCRRGAEPPNRSSRPPVELGQIRGQRGPARRDFARASANGCAARRSVAGSEVQVLGVVDGFVQQHRDVIVEQGIRHGAAASVAGDQAEVAEHPQLVGDR